MSFLHDFKIANRRVSLNEKPMIVAEISANHHQCFETAKRLVVAAKDGGADAVKFQTYTPDTITLDADGPGFNLTEGLWKGRRLYDLYKEGSLPYEWHGELFEFAKSLDLAVISSPFDEDAVDFLVDRGVDALKIASFELTHIPLIQAAAKTGLPLVVSTGMATLSEIEEALAVIRPFNQKLVVLHCVSAYPAEAKDYSLKSLLMLRDRLNCMVGLSDHCVENNVAAASVLYDAVFIEKHFTLDRAGGGLDDSFSLEPQDLFDLRARVDEMYYACRHCNEISQSETANQSLRRSIYASSAIKKGEVFSASNIKVVRPGFGLHPRHYEEILGQIAERDIAFAEPILQADLSGKVGS